LKVDRLCDRGVVLYRGDPLTLGLKGRIHLAAANHEPVIDVQQEIWQAVVAGLFFVMRINFSVVFYGCDSGFRALFRFISLTGQYDLIVRGFRLNTNLPSAALLISNAAFIHSSPMAHGR
jgi:hypothetical protein